MNTAPKSFFRTLVAVCSGFRAYREVRDLPIGSSIKYLFQLMLVLSLVLMASFVPWTLIRIEEFASWVDDRFPAFSIEQGQCVTTVTQPYRVGDPNFLFILDTTGVVTNADDSAFQGLLVMNDSFVFWMKTTNAPEARLFAQRQSLRGYPDGQVNGDYFRRLIHTFLGVVVPLAFLILLLIGVLTTLLQAYLFAVVASFTERRLTGGLQMPQLLNIAIHAVSPAAIIFTVYLAWRLQSIDLLWLVYLVVYGIFLVGATNACHDRPARATEEEDSWL